MKQTRDIRNKNRRARQRRIRGYKRIFCILCVLMSVYLVVSANVKQEPLAYEEVFVEFGDSVWSIAEEYAAEDTDIRKYVQQIEELNELSGSGLAANTVIKIPVYR